MNRPSELQIVLTTSSPDSNSLTQSPDSVPSPLSYASHSQHISVLITDTICQFLLCTETNVDKLVGMQADPAAYNLPHYSLILQQGANISP